MSYQFQRLCARACRMENSHPYRLITAAMLVFFSIHLRDAQAQQTGAATLVGAITDSTGARVPGAEVTVVNVDMAFRTTVKSNGEGDYYVPYLRPGSYRITVDAAGFKRFMREGILLRTAETPRVDITLEIGATSEQVVVTAAAPLLATETATAGAIMSSQMILAIPVAQKRANKLLLYFPAASGSSGYHVMGQRQRSIAYTLDGVSGKQPGTGSAFGVNDSIHSVLDAVEEAKVTSTGLPAEVGHSAGGSLSLVFKSGTNDLHGSFEDRIMDGTFVHRYYLQQAPNISPARFQFIDATASGPVVLPKLYNGKNKTFWLSAYAIHLEHAGETGLRYTVPSPEMLNGDFSFGGIGLPLYDPFSTRQDATGKWVRDPIPNNQISPSRFDPVAKNFLSHNPFVNPNVPGTMTRTGPVNNLAADGPKTIKRIRWDEKIDHQFSSNHKIFGRYSHARHRADRAQKYPEFAWGLLDYNSQTIPIDLINIGFNDTLLLGPGRFNEARVGYSRRHYTLNSLSYGQGWGKKLGMANVSDDTFPLFNLPPYRITSLARESQVGEDFTFQDNFTQIAGTHTLKMGYELMRTRYNAVLAALPGGSYTFAGTESPFTANTGNTFASFLLGTVGSAQFSQNFGSWLPRWWQHAFYFQDDWKVKRGLSLSLGLRWNYETPFATKYGQQSQFDPNATDPLTGRPGALTHPKDQLAARDLNNFQPRLGLAWNFLPNWVFRSSFGIMNPDLGATDIGQNFEEYQATVNVQSPSGDPRHAFVLSNTPAVTYQQSANGSVPYGGTNYSARNVSWYDPHMRTPYIMNWSAGIQRQLSPTWLLELTYQGTSGVKLLNNWNMNVIPLNISTDPSALAQIFQNQQNYKPYPQFGSINLYSNFGHNTYHAGTVRAEKRYSHGLTWMPYYTWSRTIDESDADGGANGVTYYNRRLEKARAGYDIRHHFTSILTYEFPVGRGRWLLNRGGIMNGIFGGWEVTWNQQFETGLPTTVTYSGSPYNYLSQGAYRPNALVPMSQAVVQDWSIGSNRFPVSDNRAQNPYLKFSAFGYPAAFTTGALGRNTFEGPGANWMQVSVSKSWLIRERFRIISRLDMMNLPLKQPSFNQPNSVYSANSPFTFGTMSGTRGDTSNFATGQPCFEIDIRVQF
ncbi:MAG: TonB-dependent receptor [Bryobacterales bacterium]|nr:TonB-dependent receptor [Bryobacterales bacterium]